MRQVTYTTRTENVVTRGGCPGGTASSSLVLSYTWTEVSSTEVEQEIKVKKSGVPRKIPDRLNRKYPKVTTHRYLIRPHF